MPARRSLMVLSATALVLSPIAYAHGSLLPTAAPPSSSQRFIATALNARLDAGIVAFSITAPPGVEIESAESEQPRWQARVSGQTITWEGGPIPALGSDDFAFRATLPSSEGTVEFLGREVFDDGPGPPFPFPVTVAGAAPGTAASDTSGVALTSRPARG